MEDHKEYVSEDLIGYHKGEMSNAEMHQLEKAAITDPFLSDALEGFSNISYYERSKLLRDLQSQQNKVIPINRTSRIVRYVSIAAIISGIIFGTLKLTEKKTKDSSLLVVNNDSIEKKIQKDSFTPLLAQNNQADSKKSVLEAVRLTETASNLIEKPKPKNSSVKKEEKPESKLSTLLKEEAYQKTSTASPQSNSSIVNAKADVINNQTVAVESVQSDKTIVPAKLSLKEIESPNVEQLVKYLQKEMLKKEYWTSLKLHKTLHISMNLNATGKPEGIVVMEDIPESLKEEIVILIKKGPIENLQGPIELIVPLN